MFQNFARSIRKISTVIYALKMSNYTLKISLSLINKCSRSMRIVLFDKTKKRLHICVHEHESLIALTALACSNARKFRPNANKEWGGNSAYKENKEEKSHTRSNAIASTVLRRNSTDKLQRRKRKHTKNYAAKCA